MIFFYLALICSIQSLQVVDLWKNHEEGQQILYTNNIACNFSWHLNQNIMKLDYKQFTYIIKDQKIFYINKQNNKKKEYFLKNDVLKLLTTNILDWEKILTDIKEIEEPNVIILFAKYKKKKICIYLQKNPFKILVIKIDNFILKC